MRIKEEKGITLMLLIITIIVIIIISGIVIYSGSVTMKKAGIEELKTNMLLIQSKAKGYVEEANFQMGTHPENLTDAKKEEIRTSIYVNKAGLVKASTSVIPEGDRNNAYKVGEQALKNMGLQQLESDKYYIVFDEIDLTAEIYNTDGYAGYYSLTDIDRIEIKEVK